MDEEKIIPSLNPIETKNQLIEEVTPSDPYSTVKNKNNSNQNTLEALGYLFMFITMYFVSASLGMILHLTAENIFPIIGNPGSNSGGLPDVFSWFILALLGSDFDVISPLIPHLATLIVIYPFFAILFLWVNKRTFEDPSLRKMDIRKVLFYLTLIATFIFMLYKIIYLVMNLLTGNGSMNFLSHFFITLSINLTIFLYCLYELREDKKQHV